MGRPEARTRRHLITGRIVRTCWLHRGKSCLLTRLSSTQCYTSESNEEGVMTIERPTRRMTLRQQLSHAEKCSRDILEHIHGTVLPYISDLRDLSRPVRRRSHYPTLVSLLNSLKRL